MQKNVLEYLEHSVINHGSNIAYFDESSSYTFNDIQQKSMAIASYILSITNDFNRPIVVYLPKSIDALISFHGITYSHNIYVPVDINQPVSRVENIFNVLNPSYIITSERYVSKLQNIFPKENILIFDNIVDEKIDRLAIDKAMNKQISTDPLYILFTSGSTGIPKGVCINHQSVIDYIDWLQDTFSFKDSDVFANQAPFFFDNSILDIYSVLKNGASLFITPEKYFGFAQELIDLLVKFKVTVLFWVPSALINLANSGLLKKENHLYLEKVLFCGEVMPNKQLNVWRKAYPDIVYANLYGPTEITDACAYYIVDRNFSDDEPLPIGYPCRNTDILLLNNNNQLVQGKELGEICIRGISLAHGYYNNPEKTMENFVQNPLNIHYKELIYKTGDLGYYNEHGEIIYSCRKDFQIKHNGYRIELGEIETAVASLPYINHSCVLYFDEIVLIYSSNDIIDEDTIKRDLVKIIPKYELPTKFIRLKELPMTPNGKIDRTKLKETYKGV